MGGMGFPMGVPISSHRFHPALRQELEEEYSQAEAGFVFFSLTISSGFRRTAPQSDWKVSSVKKHVIRYVQKPGWWGIVLAIF